MKFLFLFFLFFAIQSSFAIDYTKCQSTPLMQTNFYTQKSKYFFHQITIDGQQITLVLNLNELHQYRSETNQFLTLKGNWTNQNKSALLITQQNNDALFNVGQFLDRLKPKQNQILNIEIELHDIQKYENKFDFTVLQMRFRDIQNQLNQQFIGDLTLFDKVNCVQ